MIKYFINYYFNELTELLSAQKYMKPKGSLPYNKNLEQIGYICDDGIWFDSRRYQIFEEVVDLEWSPLSLLSTIEELLERKKNGSGLENLNYGRRGSVALTTRHPSIRKSWY
jgi:hypothetical protein